LTIQPARRGRHARPRRAATRAGSALTAAMLAISAALAFPAASGAASGPKFLGPVLSRTETPTMSLARDGGLSLPLPNGRDLWIFGDSPRFQWVKGRWKIAGFILGSSAAQRKFTPGKMLNGPLTEIRVGHPTKPTNQQRLFLANRKLYMPDGSGRRCNRVNGGNNVESVRWITGAALMPDKRNVLIPYVDVCVLGPEGYWSEGWGFALYNYKTNKFSMKPYDVFRPKPSGATIAMRQSFGSPIIKNGKVNFYSWECCESAQSVYRTTVTAKVSALKKPASYVPKAVPGLPRTYNIAVSRPSRTHKKITMYVLTGDKGEYEIYAASKPTGPWSKVASGQLPRCAQSPFPCRSFALHPEISPPKRLMVSYYLHGYGPGIATKHPSTKQPHTVMASIPCSC
jgi:hypothetical protein